MDCRKRASSSKNGRKIKQTMADSRTEFLQKVCLLTFSILKLLYADAVVVPG